MKKYLFITIWIISMCCLVSPTKGQSYVLDFDGIDDYIDIGADVGNGIRTIELWFKPGVVIDSSLQVFSSLVVRDDDDFNNDDEYGVIFRPNGGPYPGTMQFFYKYSMNNQSEVYSDTNSWQAQQWYHVAAVVDSITGMALYIDGVKQADTDATFTGPIPADMLNTTLIGNWDPPLNRYFNGRIEDVRFSTDAIYTNNFTPPCPDIVAMPNSKAVWNFNEGTGTIAIDSTGNGYDGTIFSATYVMDSICTKTWISENNDNPKINLYPNPASKEFSIEGDFTLPAVLELYDAMGRKVKKMAIESRPLTIDVSHLSEGLYMWHLYSKSKTVGGKVIIE